MQVENSTGCYFYTQFYEKENDYVPKLHTKVLAASFKNTEQVHKCALCGCHSVTVTEDILKDLISYPLTDAAVEGFDRDWRSVYGNKKITDM